MVVVPMKSIEEVAKRKTAKLRQFHDNDHDCTYSESTSVGAGTCIDSVYVSMLSSLFGFGGHPPAMSTVPLKSLEHRFKK